MTKELLKELEKTKDSLHEEAQDLQERAEALEWEGLEKIFRAEGMDDEGIALEKEMFDTTMRITKMLADRGKK